MKPKCDWPAWTWQTEKIHPIAKPSLQAQTPSEHFLSEGSNKERKKKHLGNMASYTTALRTKTLTYLFEFFRLSQYTHVVNRADTTIEATFRAELLGGEKWNKTIVRQTVKQQLCESLNAGWSFFWPTLMMSFVIINSGGVVSACLFRGLAIPSPNIPLNLSFRPSLLCCLLILSLAPVRNTDTVSYNYCRQGKQRKTFWRVQIMEKPLQGLQENF